MSLGASKGKARDVSRVDAEYELYGIDLSFFTQKVFTPLLLTGCCTHALLLSLA